MEVSEIKRLIDDDYTSERKKLARIGQRYYEAEHDILKYRLFYYNADGKLVEDEYRNNARISHPFFTELSDQLSSYMLSFDENPMQAKDTAEGLQDYLDEYFDDDFWTEIGELITGTYNKGFEYIYAYKNKDGRMTFQCADSMGVVEVRAKDTDDKCEYFIYWYTDRIEKGKKQIKRIQVWSAKETTYYVQERDGKIELDTEAEINPRPHVVFKDKKGKKKGYSFGFIPFWRLDNNRKRISGLKPIKPLIDDYDLMQCGLTNNLVDFDTPLHMVKGFDGDNLDELQQNLKVKKVVGVEADGDVEIKTIDIPYQARQVKASEDEKNIYRFGMGLNMTGLKDTAATTNIAIKAAYSLLDMKANKLEKRLKRLLKELLRVVIDEINETNKTGYKASDVEMVFKRSVMTNETENTQNEKVKAETQQVQINTILALAATLDDETIIKAVCDVMDIDYEEIKDRLPKDESKQVEQAQEELNNVITDEGGGTDESKAEGSAAGSS